jgi:hypothetical protein
MQCAPRETAALLADRFVFLEMCLTWVAGHNPSDHSWKSGTGFSNPSNRFWSVLSITRYYIGEWCAGESGVLPCWWRDGESAEVMTLFKAVTILLKGCHHAHIAVCCLFPQLSFCVMTVVVAPVPRSRAALSEIDRSGVTAWAASYESVTR